MPNTTNSPITAELFSLQDTTYRDFQSKLVPNIPKETIIGVRTPEMRRVAKKFFGTKEGSEFLAVLPHRYYDENLVHFFMISLIKDFDECITEVERFLPFVDCWPVCDQASPKVFGKNHDKLLPYIKQWISSDHIYTSRYGMRILMNEFLGEDFKAEYPELIAQRLAKKGEAEDYYLKMMVAWYFATALAKQYDAVIPFIENHKLEPWTHNKAIQKAIESYRISPEQKEYLRGMKIK